MCFPSKRQKNNFTDDPKPDPNQAKNGLPTKAETSSATQPPADSAPPTLPQVATTETATTMPPAKVGIIIYSMYGHVAKMAEAVKAGVIAAGGEADILQVPETLDQTILTKMHAPAKPNYPVATVDDLTKYNAFLFGIPTRYGNMPAQWKAFWDATGQLWAGGALTGKYAGIFVSTAGPGGGQESTFLASMSTLAHHGINFVPFGYSRAFAQISNLEEVHGGSPWGAGTYSSSTGARQPSALELEIAKIQGESFAQTIAKVTF